MKRVIYPGSFNPLHKGHIYVIEEALKIFDELILLVSQSSNKPKTDSVEKVRLIEKKLGDNPKIKVIKYDPKKLTGEIAEELGCDAIIRGIRNEEDFKYEQDLANGFRKVCPNIPFLTIIATDENKELSSTLMREIKSIKGDKYEF